MENVGDSDRENVKKMLRVAGEYSIQRLLLNFGCKSDRNYTVGIRMLIKLAAASNTTSFITKLSDLVMEDGTAPPQSLLTSLGDWVKQWTVRWDQIEHRLRGETWYMAKGKIQTAAVKAPILYHALAPTPDVGTFVMTCCFCDPYSQS